MSNERFKKVISVIRSCETIEQLNVCSSWILNVHRFKKFEAYERMQFFSALCVQCEQIRQRKLSNEK
jgi:hypothetical protein